MRRQSRGPSAKWQYVVRTWYHLPMTRMGRSTYDQLVAEGRIVPAEADLLDFTPLPVPPRMPTLSEILAEMRADEHERPS